MAPTEVARRDRVTMGKLRASGGDGAPLVLEGTAIRYGDRTELRPGWHEQIAPGGARRALADAPGLVLLAHHDHARPLARRGKNMVVVEDSTGVHFRATLPDTTEARDIHTLVADDVIGGVSFGFSPSRGGNVRSERLADGSTLDTVNDVGKLWEISAVTDPAYPTTTISARSRDALDRLNRGHAMSLDALRSRTTAVLEAPDARARRPAGSTVVRAVDPYASGSRYSYFVDQLVAGWTRNAAPLPGDAPPVPLIDVGLAPSFDATPERARERLATVPETRAGVTSTPGFGGEFDNYPHPIAEAFAVAARAVGVVAGVLGVHPLELRAGNTVKNARITSGASAVIQVDAGAVAQADIATAPISAPVVLIAGQQVGSWQINDLSNFPSLDVAIAAEFGATVAAALDAQLLNGSGIGGQMLGLLNLAGTTAQTFTSATPVQSSATPASSFYSQVLRAMSQSATARGRLPTSLILGTRRWSWWLDGLASTAAPLVEMESLEGDDGDYADPLAPVGGIGGLRVYATPAMPSTLGAGAEDRAIVLRPDSVWLAATQPIFRTSWQATAAGPATGQLVFTCHQYAALLPRYAAGVAVIGGTGLTTTTALAGF